MNSYIITNYETKKETIIDAIFYKLEFDCITLYAENGEAISTISPRYFSINKINDNNIIGIPSSKHEIYNK